MAVEMPALSQFSGYKVSRRKRSISQKGFSAFVCEVCGMALNAAST